MTLVQTRRWVQEPIKVGQDIAGFRYTVTVLANLNTQTLGADGGNRIGGVNPSLRGLTLWNALREQLMAQRRPFRFIVGNVVVADIQTESINIAPNAVDIQLGPKPLACNVVQFNGGGSVLVEYTIQWQAPNPCAAGKTGGPPNGMAVLAHVWASDDDLDKDFFVTRTYRGRIHLDPRVAGPAGTIHPDTLRGAMFPALAGPFRRDNITAKVSEDGYTYDYVIKDVQPYQLVASTEITRMTATHSVRHTVPTPKEYLEAAGQVAGAVTGIAGASGGARAAAGVGGFFSVGSAYWSILPTAVHSFEATAFGHNGTSYASLASAARAVCLWRLMKLTGVGITDPWGGSAETVNNSDPRSVVFRMEIVRRPRELQQWTRVDGGVNQGAFRLENQPATEAVWALGRNDMPTIQPGGGTADVAITTPTGVAIPAHIRQLVYGATPGYLPGDWNGPTQQNPAGFPSGGSFAPDLMTNNPNGPRANYPWGTGAFTSNLFSLALIAALQDPCAYKKAVSFPAQTYPTTTGGLPGG